MRTLASIALAAIVATTACTTAGGGPCYISIDPMLADEMPDLDMLVGDTVETPLEDHFYNADSGCIRAQAYGLFDAQSSVPSAVAVSILDSPFLRTIALDVADSVRVTVAAWDSPSHEFVVRVRAAVGARGWQ